MARKPKQTGATLAKATIPLPPQPEAAADTLFDAILDAEEHRVPPERRAGLFAAYQDLRKQAAIVRSQPLVAAIEPANTFSLVPFTAQTKREA